MDMDPVHSPIRSLRRSFVRRGKVYTGDQETCGESQLISEKSPKEKIISWVDGRIQTG